MTISVKTIWFAQLFFIFSQHYLHYSRNGSPKFQSYIVSSFGITVLDSIRRKSKEINLYSDYTKLQAFTFAAITSIWISLQSWDLAYHVHHRLAEISFPSKCMFVQTIQVFAETVTYVYKYIKYQPWEKSVVFIMRCHLAV